MWNSFCSPLFSIDIGVGQESTLSSIISALYISPIFCNDLKLELRLQLRQRLEEV